MHTDYSIHPLINKERRINLIIYLTNEWDINFKGSIELWDKIEATTLKTKIAPIFNRAIIFKTFDNSYHGFPKLINCPDNITRNSIAIYYISEPRKNACKNKKAHYYLTDNKEKEKEKYKKLITIRNERRIMKEDLNDFPKWIIKYQNLNLH